MNPFPKPKQKDGLQGKSEAKLVDILIRITGI